MDNTNIEKKYRNISYMKIKRFNKVHCDFCKKYELIYARYPKFLGFYNVCKTCFETIKDCENKYVKE